MLLDKYKKMMKCYLERLNEEEKEELDGNIFDYEEVCCDFESAQNKRIEIESKLNWLLERPEEIENEEQITKLKEKLEEAERFEEIREQDAAKCRERLEEICPFGDDIIEDFKAFYHELIE